MITAIGKELRKLRIDHDERLIDMADRLEKSASFISAIEIGKKPPPSGFEDLVVKVYSLASEAAAALQSAADISRTAFKLEPNSDLARGTAGMLARRINSLTDTELNDIQAILARRDPE